MPKRSRRTTSGAPHRTRGRERYRYVQDRYYGKGRRHETWCASLKPRALECDCMQ